MNPTPRAHAARLLASLLLSGAAAWVHAADPKASQYYEDALQRYEKKDYPGAVVQLKNVIRLDKKNLSAQVLLGKSLLATGAMGPAEVALTEALTLGVNRAEVVVYLAQAFTGQGKLQQIVSDERFNPDGLPDATKAQILLMKAAAQSDLGSPRESLKLIESARALAPKVADSWQAEIPIRIRARQFAEAHAAAKKAIELAPTSAEAQYLSGSIFHVESRVSEALEAYNKALALDATHTESLIARAGLNLDRGQLEDVLRDVNEVKRLSPSDPRAPFLAGQVADRQADAKGARAKMQEVTALLDTVPLTALRFRPQILIMGGMAHYALGNGEKARPYLETIVRQQPDSPAAKLLGQIYLGAGENDKAIEAFEAYVKAHANDQQVLILLATAQLGKGRHARAAQLMQEAIKIQDSPRARTILGLTLVGGGKRGDALAEFENAYRRDPSQLAAGAALVDIYVSRGEGKKALIISEALVKRWSKEASLQALHGRALALLGQTDKARAALEAALAIDNNFVPAQLELARLDIRTKQYDPAEKRLSAIISKNEKNVDALLTVADLALIRGQRDVATRFLQKAVDHSGPRELRPGLILVSHHLAGGDLPGATLALGALNSKAPDAVSVLLANARVRMAAKDNPAAQTFLSRASRTAGFDAPLLAEIATMQMSAGDAKGAQTSLSKAMQAQPDFIPARALAVEANLRAGDAAAAEQIVKELLARNANSAQAQALKGDVALARGQVPAAVEAYKRSHQLEPTSFSVQRLYVGLSRQDPDAAGKMLEAWIKSHAPDPRLSRMLAEGYARAGKFSAAKDAFRTLVEQTPQDADALNNYANVLLRTNDPQALSVAERALTLKPQSASIIGTVGWAAFVAGQSDRGLQLLRDAKVRDPANPENRYYLGAALAKKGRGVEAREELRAALDSGPGFVFRSDAQALLQTLK